MAWIAFKLGRPGAELTFSLNPAGLSITDGNIKVVHRNLEGDLRKSVIKAGLPTIGINSNYFTKVERDLFVSLLNITDSFLSFQVFLIALYWKCRLYTKDVQKTETSNARQQ